MARRISTMYDVERSVGRNGQNSSLDVMLIQFFLFSIFMNSGWPLSGQISMEEASEPSAIFPINGIHKPALNTWISIFQRAANKRGLGPLFDDGRVDPSNVGWGLRSGRTAGRRTIMIFNQILLNADRKRFERIPFDPHMPPSLGSELQMAFST